MNILPSGRKTIVVEKFKFCTTVSFVNVATGGELAAPRNATSCMTQFPAGASCAVAV